MSCDRKKSSAHWSCNINLKLTKKVPIIFHNLKDYDCRLIMLAIGKSDVEISVIPNGLETYIDFTIKSDLVFIDSIQFVNSSLVLLFKNLSEMCFEYLSEEFNAE